MPDPQAITLIGGTHWPEAWPPTVTGKLVNGGNGTASDTEPFPAQARFLAMEPPISSTAVLPDNVTLPPMLVPNSPMGATFEPKKTFPHPP